jgi:repressor LexA
MRYKDQSLLDSISSYIGEIVVGEGRVPSNREVGEHFRISKSCAQKYMSTISKQGLCKQLNKYRDDCRKAAIVDTGLSCGTPTYEDTSITEYVRLPVPLFGTEEKIVTHASGDSMINAGIDDGDTLIISRQTEAKDGEIVIATLNGASTLKTYMHHKDGRPYLHPENSSYEDIEIHEGDAFFIQGVLIYVLKNYRGYRSELVYKECVK